MSETVCEYYDVAIYLPEEQLQQIILKLQEAIRDPNKPYVIDFNEPSKGRPKQNARWIVRCDKPDA